MAKDEKAGKKAGIAVSKALKSGSAGKDSKTAAGSALKPPQGGFSASGAVENLMSNLPRFARGSATTDTTSTIVA